MSRSYADRREAMSETSELKRAAHQAVDEIRSGFAACGWDIDAAVGSVNAFNRSTGRPAFDPRRDSVHLLMIAAALQRSGVERVLELGTFTGETAALIAALAPKAEIVTVDLPEGAFAYEHYVELGSPDRETFLRVRDRNLASPNIRFVRADSFLLSPRDLGEFDLVWVDAWHRFPNVAWDIHLAYHVCRPGGFVLCDDVEQEARADNPFSGADGHQVATYLEGLGLAPRLFMKRLAAEYLLDDRRRAKYVMAFQAGTGVGLAGLCDEIGGRTLHT